MHNSRVEFDDPPIWLSSYDSAMVMAQKDSKFAGLTEELKVKKKWKVQNILFRQVILIPLKGL